MPAGRGDAGAGVRDGNLLDHSMIIYGGGLSNGNVHLHTDLPILLAGGGAGQLGV